jgi:hypothetical protein
MGLSARLRRLEQRRADHHAHTSTLDELWCHEALAQLTDGELEALERASAREADLGAGDAFPQRGLSPEEQAAFNKFLRYYEEAQHHHGS